MNRKISTILIISLITLGMSLTWAGSSFGRCGDGPDCGKRKMSCFDAPGGPIDLTEAQYKEISQLRQAEQEKLAPIHEKLEQIHEKLHSAMESDDLDEGEIRQLARQKADRKVDLKLAKREFRTKIESILTPEQVIKMKEHKESHRGGHGRHGDGHGKHHGKSNCEHHKGLRD